MPQVRHERHLTLCVGNLLCSCRLCLQFFYCERETGRPLLGQEDSSECALAANRAESVANAVQTLLWTRELVARISLRRCLLEERLDRIRLGH